MERSQRLAQWRAPDTDIIDVRWCVRTWFSWPIVSRLLNNHCTTPVNSSLPVNGNQESGLGYEMAIHAHAGTHRQGAV